MQKWEYTYVYLTYDDKKRNWVSEFNNRKWEGYKTILDAFGENGWELVNVVTSATASFQGASVTQYIATFKRQRE